MVSAEVDDNENARRPASDAGWARVESLADVRKHAYP